LYIERRKIKADILVAVLAEGEGEPNRRQQKEHRNLPTYSLSLVSFILYMYELKVTVKFEQKYELTDVAKGLGWAAVFMRRFICLKSVFFQGWFCVPLPTAPVTGRGTNAGYHRS
jgi:hypothetical protein